MHPIQHYTGTDMGQKSFTFSVYRPGSGSSRSRKYENTPAGFAALEQVLTQQGFVAEETLLCLEDCGVSTESFCHYFYHRGYRLWLESPKKTKHAFQLEDKDDEVEAQQLAE